MSAAPSFSINILSADQEDLSRRFATSKIRAHERYEGVAWHAGSTGAPLLDGCLAHIDCEVAEKLEGGDHTIFLGRVVTAEVSEGQPLLFFRGKYGQWSPKDAPV